MLALSTRTSQRSRIFFSSLYFFHFSSLDTTSTWWWTGVSGIAGSGGGLGWSKSCGTVGVTLPFLFLTTQTPIEDDYTEQGDKHDEDDVSFIHYLYLSDRVIFRFQPRIPSNFIKTFAPPVEFCENTKMKLPYDLVASILSFSTMLEQLGTCRVNRDYNKLIASHPFLLRIINFPPSTMRRLHLVSIFRRSAGRVRELKLFPVLDKLITVLSLPPPVLYRHLERVEIIGHIFQRDYSFLLRVCSSFLFIYSQCSSCKQHYQIKEIKEILQDRRSTLQPAAEECQECLARWYTRCLLCGKWSCYGCIDGQISTDYSCLNLCPICEEKSSFCDRLEMSK